MGCSRDRSSSFVNSNIQLQEGQIVDVLINDAGNFDLSGDLVTW